VKSEVLRYFFCNEKQLKFFNSKTLVDSKK
jgi:YHS domain-containing protein